MKRIFLINLVIFILILLSACSNNVIPKEEKANSSYKIYLYGENHGVEKIINKEFELWNDYYHKDNMRHLFIELPYYTAEYLNIWMKSDNDEIINNIYDDLKGTAGHNPYSKEFYKKIKEKCPETIFHGTDVGHQYNSTGDQFLEYLKKNNMKESKEYLLAVETIEQGENYYKNYDEKYRENKMSENFIREYNNLNDLSIMGIYGSAHTELNGMDYETKTIPCMANQLKEVYGDIIYSENLEWVIKDIEPERIDIIKIKDKEYKAFYYGKIDISSWSNEYTYREFWKLENAYSYFKKISKTGNILPYSNYPMLITEKEIFIIDYTKKDGSVKREYHISDGYLWNEMLSTEDFILN